MCQKTHLLIISRAFSLGLDLVTGISDKEKHPQQNENKIMQFSHLLPIVPSRFLFARPYFKIRIGISFYKRVR